MFPLSSSFTLTLLPFRKWKHKVDLIATIISDIVSADDNDAVKVECLSKYSLFDVYLSLLGLLVTTLRNVAFMYSRWRKIDPQ